MLETSFSFTPIYLSMCIFSLLPVVWSLGRNHHHRRPVWETTFNRRSLETTFHRRPMETTFHWRPILEITFHWRPILETNFHRRSMETTFHWRPIMETNLHRRPMETTFHWRPMETNFHRRDLWRPLFIGAPFSLETLLLCQFFIFIYNLHSTYLYSFELTFHIDIILFV